MKSASVQTIPETHQESTAMDYALVCVAPIIWGASGVFVRWTHLAGHEQVLIFYRSCFAVAFYAIVMLVTRRRPEFRFKGQAPLLVTSGLLAAAFAFCVFKAYNLLPIGVATFILYLFPVLVAVMAPLLLKEKTERGTIICLAIALAGTGVFSWGQLGGGGSSSAKGLVLAFGSAVFWGLLIIIWKKLRETLSPLTIGFWTNLVAGVVTAGFAIPLSGIVTAKGWAAIGVFGTVSFGVAGLIYFYALKRVKAQDAALLSYIEPVSAMIFGFALLGESPNWQDLVGAVLILAAGALLLRMRTSGREVPVIPPDALEIAEGPSPGAEL
jgi:drug/metabolite transporter (DMT)-like permease